MELFDDIEKKLIALDGPVSHKPHLRTAAVLIPIFINKGQILFTKRTENLKHHQGQISFPGGKYDETDENLLNTVLRETEEEIGVTDKYIELKGRMNPMVSTSQHYVYPFIGFIRGSPKIRMNPVEVEEYFFVDINLLLEPETLETGFYKGSVKKYYHVNNYKIWGLTQLILSKFLSLL